MNQINLQIGYKIKTKRIKLGITRKAIISLASNLFLKKIYNISIKKGGRDV